VDDLREGNRTLDSGIELRVHRLGEMETAPAITAVYFDPARVELELLTAQSDGEPRSTRRWSLDYGLVAAINASMYLPNLRSTGWMIDEGIVNNPAINPSFGGVLAFDPLDAAAPPWRFTSPDCEDSILVSLPRAYTSVVQNYRLLDCDGESIGWKDPKRYSVAAIGLDRRGWLVFLHSGDPCRTTDFGRWISDPVFDLVAAHFVEGGPDASLFVRWSGGELEILGRYQGTGPGRARSVPNVLGLRLRDDED